jgi:2-isopropylmalate synthase
VGAGSDATAVAYVEATGGDGAGPVWGVGLSPNILTASLRAVVSVANRLRSRADSAPGILSPVHETDGVPEL